MAEKRKKVATNIDEQIKLLRSRNMVFGSESKARENLGDIGYYRLGFYWFPFETTYPRINRRDHIFKPDTKFENVIKLYYFDFDLRNTFLKYISRVEINFRTKLIYTASNFYHDNPFWYVDSNCVKKKFLESEEYQHALRNLKKEMVIIRDLNRYGRTYAPAWKAIEFMSLGNVKQLFDNLEDKDGIIRSQISMQYDVASPNQFSDYMDVIRRLRNSCAHGKVIFDYKMPGAISNTGPVKLYTSQMSNLAGTYAVFKYILGKISMNRVNDMRNDLQSAFGKITDTNVMSIITQNSGLEAKNL